MSPRDISRDHEPHVIVVGPCWGCGRIFTYNPKHVPSVSNDGICPDCMAEINRQLVARGKEPFEIHPQAYEPLPEADL